MIRHSDSFSSPAFPLAAFLWPTKGLTSQWVVLPSVLMIVGLFRWCVGLWGYSGQSARSVPSSTRSTDGSFWSTRPSITTDARGL